jgi:hypothetical protein
MKLKKQAMLEALKKTFGVVTQAAELAGIERTTHYKWLESDPEYKQAFEQMPDIALDFVESQAYKGIEDGDKSLIIFYLKTKGRKRGYVERSENINRNIDESFDISKLNDEQLQQYIEYTEKLFKGDSGKEEKEG